jgi:hypothetical protein
VRKEVVSEVLIRPDSREKMIHFVNFDQQKRLESFDVQLKKNFRAPVELVQLFLSEEDEPVHVDFQVNGETVSLRVPSMKLYSMIVVAQ